MNQRVNKFGLAVAIALALSLGSAASAQQPKTEKEKVSYMVGMDVGNMMRDIQDEVELEMVFAGVRATLAGGETALSAEEYNALRQTFMAKLQAKQQQEMAAVSERSKQFLEENKKKPGVSATESGLQYRVIIEGQGAKPVSTDTVRVHYRGTLIDGTEFDSSYKRNEPTEFPLTGVIPGWTEGLQLMTVGSKYEFVIPSDLAYGPNGQGPIPPDATLVFEVELLEVKGQE